MLSRTEKTMWEWIQSGKRISNFPNIICQDKIRGIHSDFLLPTTVFISEKWNVERSGTCKVPQYRWLRWGRFIISVYSSFHWISLEQYPGKGINIRASEHRELVNAHDVLDAQLNRWFSDTFRYREGRWALWMPVFRKHLKVQVWNFKGRFCFGKETLLLATFWIQLDQTFTKEGDISDLFRSRVGREERGIN